MYTAAILAGGKGRRLGGVLKPLIVLNGRRIIDRQLSTLETVVDHVMVVTADADPFRDLQVPVWVDQRPGFGPLGGILTALIHAPTSRTLIVAGDMPFLSASLLRRIVDAEPESDIVVPRTRRGYQPLCASYDRSCIDTIRRHLDAGVLAVHALFTSLRIHEIGIDEAATLDPEGTLFFNINTPEDVSRAQVLAAQQSA